MLKIIILIIIVIILNIIRVIIIVIELTDRENRPKDCGVVDRWTIPATVAKLELALA